jgi:O-antigen/teichoic acid export membrane protein
MIEEKYLLKVLGLTGIPKIITFGLTLFSYPILLNSLGAETYGIFLFVASSLVLFEILMDLGISSAAGKSIASIRAHYQPTVIRSVFYVWARLQAFFVLVGFVPMIGLTYLVIEGGLEFEGTTLLLVMSATTAIRTVTNFLRPNLQSLLSFKSLAVLDIFESVTRSLGFLLVAFFFPSLLGLAYVELFIATLTSIFAIVLITLVFSNMTSNTSSETIPKYLKQKISIKSCLRESADFLWLRFSTRLFYEAPILIFGSFLGAETVGVVGAFRKITEILSTPYLIIGNAIMVRINEIGMHGESALRSLWNAVMKIISTSLFFAVLVFFMTGSLAEILFPESSLTVQLFPIMTILVFIHVVFAMVAPMSDYLGGLRTRNIFLTAVSFIQLLVLWGLASTENLLITIISHVVISMILSIGYSLIAHKVFFNNYTIRLQSEIKLFILGVILSLSLVLFITYIINDVGDWIMADVWNFPMIGFVGLFSVWILGVGQIRRAYFNKDFLELGVTQSTLNIKK